MKSHQLNHILDNKTLGSSELVQLLNKYFLSIHGNKSEISRSLRLARIKLGHFETVNSYLKDLSSELKNGNGLETFLKSHSLKRKEKFEIIFKKIYPRLKKLKKLFVRSKGANCGLTF